MTHKPPAKKVRTTPSATIDTSSHRRNAISCRGRKCPDCIILDVRSYGDPEPRNLQICKPHLWITDISHLIMMLEMRVGRIKDPVATNSTNSGMSLSKMDEMIGKDIEDVLRHWVVPGEWSDRVGEFVGRVEDARGVLGGVHGFEYGKGLGDVVERMRRMGRV